jgi:hypothetical protein
MIKLKIVPTSELTTRDAWARLGEFNKILSTIVKILWPHETHRVLAKKLHQLDKAGSMDLKSAAQCWGCDSRSPLTGKYKPIQTALIVNYIEAAVYISRVNPSSASIDNNALFIRTAYHIGALEWHIGELEIQQKFTTRAQTGGKAKSLKVDTVRDKIIDLLLDKTHSDEGWPSIEKTAEILLPKIEEHITNNMLSKYIEDPFEFIKRALSEGITKKAYIHFSEKEKRKIQAPTTK